MHFGGRLLVSSPALVDPHFRRTVVLLTHHDEEGAVGLVLSRPSALTIAEAVPDLGPLPFVDEIVYVGGPVEPEAVIVLAEYTDPQPADPIVGAVGFLSPSPEREPAELRRARVFAGYAGWGGGQLEGELNARDWIVVDAEPDDVFARDPDVLWRAVVARQGGRYALLASMPFDPNLN